MMDQSLSKKLVSGEKFNGFSKFFGFFNKITKYSIKNTIRPYQSQ